MKANSIRTAVVLIPGGDDARSLAMVAGLPLVERNLMALRAVGVDCAYLSGDRGVLVEHFSRRAADARLPEVRFDDRLEDVAAHTPGLLLVLEGGRIYHRELLQDAVSRRAEVSYRLPDGRFAGIRIVSQGSLAGRNSSGPSQAVPVPDKAFSLPAESTDERRTAERLIFRSLTKPTDGWISIYINRPISTMISRRLARYPIHPNLITALSIVLAGLPAGIFSALGTYWGFAVGGVLFQLRSMLDGVDGEIARVKHLSSRGGQIVDTIGDFFSDLFYLSGVTIGVYRSHESDLLLWLGIAAVVLLVLEVLSIFWLLETRSSSISKMDVEWIFKRPGADDKPLSRLLLALEPFTKRDFYSAFFMVLALAGMAWMVLPAAAIGFGAILAVIYTQAVLGYVRGQPPA